MYVYTYVDMYTHLYAYINIHIYTYTGHIHKCDMTHFNIRTCT